ncbi:MAG: isoaspartyl peptidase/L-asparaginase [Myxococcota bacterium]|jgi:beta-aspartyl-peptidase (threonine type)|nr:isoaspartyl peptidase/L-asparaginase [Myxococcota bacterium]
MTTDTLPLPTLAATGRVALVVHGGAWDIPDEEWDAHRAGVRVALAAGWEVLAAGGPAREAVCRAVQLLEDDPTFDAGRGSTLNRQGEIELDAALAIGEGAQIGAVAAIRTVAHPILAARAVLEGSEHVLLVGAGAERFAREAGLPEVDPASLLVERERRRWAALRQRPEYSTRQPFEPGGLDRPRGTVGAVARDRAGRLAAATSTGGTPGKLPGRVGDSAIPGAGTAAEEGCGAVSCTGWGEGILRVSLARRVLEGLEAGLLPPAAAGRALARLGELTGGRAGLICLDAAGRIGLAHTTPRMAWASRTEDGLPEVVPP